jgi:type II secretory pathway pseudopilin PulG
MRNPHSQAGFTLTDMVVSMAIVTASLLAALGLLDVSNKYAKSQEQIVRMNQNIRIAIDQMVRETQLAGSGLFGGMTSGIGTCWLEPSLPDYSSRDTLLSCSVFDSDGEDRLVIYTDSDGDSVPGLDPDIERITYRLDGDLLLRDEDNWDPDFPDADPDDPTDPLYDPDDPASSPVAENVESLILDPGADSVTITIRGQTEEIDPVTKEYRQFVLTSTAYVRSES